MPEPEGIVFVGSSSIRMWDTARAFPDLKVLNRGFGGSQIADSVRFADRIVVPYKPRLVVFYAGDNDINGKKTAEQVLADYQAFVKKVRAHSPDCKIVLFPWWIPSGPSATNAGVMKVFHHCVDAAKANKIWVATTGPAFTEARLARPDLNITVNKGDAHPGAHGAYLNACSLYAILTDESPVGLPATLKIPRREKDLTITAEDAKYLQELAWKVYQRELKDTKPVK